MMKSCPPVTYSLLHGDEEEQQETPSDERDV